MDKVKITNTREFRIALREQKDFWRARLLETDDITGYTFAEEWVEGGYRKWRTIVNGTESKAEVAEWLNALEVKLQSKGFLEIAKRRDNFNAMKYLADKGWTETPKRSKKKEQEDFSKLIESDMERLGMRPN